MKKVSLFLISATLLWTMIKLLEKRKGNHEVFSQREQEIPNLLAAGYDDNEIASFLRAGEKGIQESHFYR